MSDKCPINLVCTCYVGDDQNERQDMPCYACVLEGKENAETARDRLWEYLGKLEHYVLSHFEDETRTRKWIEANQPQMDVARDALAGGSTEVDDEKLPPFRPEGQRCETCYYFKVFQGQTMGECENKYSPLTGRMLEPGSYCYKWQRCPGQEGW